MKKKHKRRGGLKGVIAFVLVLAVILLAGIKLPSFFTESIGEKPFPEHGRYRSVRVDTADIRAGDLILINAQNAYDFDMAEKKYPIASLKNEYYQVKNDEISLNKKTIRQFNALFQAFYKETGLDTVSIISAYRDYEYQENVLNERISAEGYYSAITWVAMPGYSEHHTGLAADIAVVDENGDASTFTGEDAYAYIGENAWKYGFINRYPADKTDITGISNEPWHYRYVGKPHAYVMKQTGMCLEEYVDYIKSFVFGDRYLDVNIHGDEYKIYYVPAAPEDKTKIGVPLIGRYSISGNNTDGFIVTAKG